MIVSAFLAVVTNWLLSLLTLQKVPDIDDHVRERLRFGQVACGKNRLDSIPGEMGLAINLNRFIIEIHNPHFRNAGAPVNRKFFVYIPQQRRVGNLDQQKNVSRLRVTFFCWSRLPTRLC